MLTANEHCRKAERSGGIYLHNMVNGKCIRLDQNSYEGWHYIKKFRPEISDVTASFKQRGIMENEVLGLIEWLKQTGFIAEADYT